MSKSTILKYIAIISITLLLSGCFYNEKEDEKSEHSDEIKVSIIEETAEEKAEEVVETVKETIVEETTKEAIVGKVVVKEEKASTPTDSVIQTPKEVKKEEKTVVKTSSNKTEAYRVIEINAVKWEFDKKEIIVKKGEKVKLKLINVEGTHGIGIPSMNIETKDELILDTSKVGEFEFICIVYCGHGHGAMKGKIIIVE